MLKKDYSHWDKKDLIAEIKKLEKRKKYGLVWDEERTKEVFELQALNGLPVLDDVPENAINTNPAQPTNILIEGDNFHALSVLSYTHEKSIDVIYIDPPYNTGARDWKYNNDYVDSKDAYRHSKWLSMMAKRLSLSKNLLKKDGVLVIAIDDNEVHRLRLLIEEIFPEYDTTSVTVVQNPRGNITNNFARTHEYALFLIPKGLSVIKRIKKENTSPRKLRRWGHNSTRLARPTMFYPIYVKDGEIVRIGIVPDVDFHPKSKNIKKRNGEIEVYPIDQDGVERRWNFGLDSIEGELDRIVAIEVDGEIDMFLTQEDTTPKTVWTDSKFEAGRNGATLVKSLTGKDFPYPKSIFTVKQCLELIVKDRPEAIILDYFAGSGTTGHAVSILNKEDSGSRRFILCTNNENGIAREICFPRIKAVIKGNKDYPDITKIPSNLKYFRTSFVPSEPSDENKELLTRQSVEMLCLREATFDFVAETDMWKLYENNEHFTAILFDQLSIPDLKEELEKLKKPVSVYVFSLEDDNFANEFADMKDKVKVCSIPEAILRVYRRIYQ